MPAIPVYLLARRIDRPIGHVPAWLSPAVFAAGFILLDLLHAEMIVTGALPLIGFALLGMVWWSMGELAEEWSLHKAVILAASLGLIPWVNQTTAGLAIVSIPVYGAALLWFNFRPGFPLAQRHYPHTWFAKKRAARRLAIPLFFGGLIALGALPWYLDVLPVSGQLAYPGPFLYLTHSADSAWLQLFLAAPLGAYVIWKAQAPWLRSMGVLIIFLGVLVPWLSTDETVINIFYRARYLMALPVFVVLSWAVFTQWWPRIPLYAQKAVYGGLVTAVAVMAVGYVSQFDRQLGYSEMISDDTAAALALIPDDGKAVVNNSYTMAHWIAALHESPAPHTWTWNPPPDFVETDAHVRCVLGWRPECSSKESVHALNAGYLLIEGRFPYYNDRAPGVYGSTDVLEPWSNLPDVPWLTLMFEQGTTQLWRIE